jgi:hypothetical protein
MSDTLPHFPLIYRVFFLWLEPLMALGGSVLCHFDPASFLRTMSATASYSPSSQVIYDQLAATYVLFAFNEAVVLRVTKDLRVWKMMMAGLLLCDGLHLYASWSIMGTHAFMRPWLWRPEDILNLILLYIPVILRTAFIRGAGFATHGTKKIV